MKILRLLVMLLLCGAVLASASEGLEGKMADEFAYLSGQTRQAMEFSPLELEGLIRRCDSFLEQVETLKGSEKKVMRKKVEKLRGLFLYVLASKSLVTEGATEK